MGKANKISSKHPIFSGLTAAFGIASLASFVSSGTVPAIADYIAAAGLTASPILCAATTAIGVASIFKQRSVLSKAFNLAAAGFGGTALYTAAENLDGSQGIMGLFAISAITLVGMTGAGALNTAAHYLRDTGWGAPKNDTPAP